MIATKERPAKSKRSLATAKPKGEYILIRQDTPGFTEGGIQLSDRAKLDPARFQIGVVVAVGPGMLLLSGERSKPCVVVGESVIFNAQAAERVKSLELDEDTGCIYLFVKETHILGSV